MKVTSKSTVTSITLELTEEEATAICALAGGVMWNLDAPAGQIIQNLWSELDLALPNRTESFFDFFEGDVEVRSK